MRLDELSDLAAGLDHVSQSRHDGLLAWRYHGRLVARQLDDTHIVIRAGFDDRDALVRNFPETFSVPSRFVKHMMVCADLRKGDDDAIAEAVADAWRLQSQR